MVEYVDVLDDDGNIIDVAERDYVHKNGLWHRGVSVIVKNYNRDILVPVRSRLKDRFPLCYDVSIAEHCIADEDYLRTAYRGLREELGIEDIYLRPLKEFRIDHESDRMIVFAFEGDYKGSIKYDPDEIDHIELKSEDELREIIKYEEERFAPWAREVYRWYLFEYKK